MVKKAKVINVHPFERVSDWSMERLGYRVVINPDIFDFSNCIPSIDIEDDESGGFVGLGLFPGGSSKEVYYWSDLSSALKVKFGQFIAHNGISDIKKMQKWGISVSIRQLFWDTQLIEHLLDSTQKMYGLKDICKRRQIGEWPDYHEITGKKTAKERRLLGTFPVEQIAQYNACDCIYTKLLQERQEAECKSMIISRK